MQNSPSLGFVFHPTFPPENIVPFARQAEAAGFDELWFWEDCFFAGALTSAATALAATQTIKVGIGILPAVVRNPLFTAMEITTLARLYPGRFIPGFGHGVDIWMKQIGVYPKSPLKALEETVMAVRGLLHGEKVTLLGQHVHLENVQLNHIPQVIPPLLVGGIREKSLQLAGRVGDGVILTGMSSPAYLRWADTHIKAGIVEAGRSEHLRVVDVLCEVSPDGRAARHTARSFLARQIKAGDSHLLPAGIAEEAAELARNRDIAEIAELLPETWVDDFSASGTPQQVAQSLERIAEAGATSLILEPIFGDPDALQDYIRYLLPIIKHKRE